MKGSKTNYGFKIPVIKDEHWKFGSANTRIKGVPLIPNGDWRPLLPPFEYQARNGFDPNSCALHTTTHAYACIFKKQYNINRDDSERYLGVISNSDEDGNNPDTVAEAARLKGLVPEGLLPFDNTITNFKQWASPKPMSSELLREGQRLLDLFKLGHEWVPNDHASITEALKYSPLGVAVCAWIVKDIVDGQPLYYFPQGAAYNHDCLLVYEEPGKYYEVFDTYDQQIKRIDWNAELRYIKRFAVALNNDTSIMQQILLKIAQLIPLLAFMVKQKTQIAPRPAEPLVTLPDENLPLPVVPSGPKKWTKEELVELAKQKCLAVGLTPIMTGRLLKTVEGESNWDNDAVRINTNKTKDYYLCQFNDYWYIGPDRPIKSIEEAHDPNISLQVMAEQFKKGRASDWLVYRKLYL